MKRSRDRKSHSTVPQRAPKLSRENPENQRNSRGIEELTVVKIKQNSELDVSILVNELAHELGYEQDRILQRLMELEASKKTKIQEKTPYKSFLDYAKSPTSL